MTFVSLTDGAARDMLHNVLSHVLPPKVLSNGFFCPGTYLLKIDNYHNIVVQKRCSLGGGSHRDDSNSVLMRWIEVRDWRKHSGCPVLIIRLVEGKFQAFEFAQLRRNMLTFVFFC